jgi:hypothetical protein
MSIIRIGELEEFARRIKTLNIEDDEQFCGFVVASLEILEMTDRDFADSLSVSRPCVSRWSNGKNLPRTATRKATASSVTEKVNRRIRALRQAVSRSSSSVPAYTHAHPIAAKGR